MTGLGVERAMRVAYPAPSVPPAGVSSSLPPHIQGAERRSENRARRTGSRWGLRVLVVGGLAGAAWLLTGAAAQAADRDGGLTGSLLGSVVDSTESGAISPVTGLLKAAAQPLEAARPAHHQHNVVADIIEVPRRVLTRPAETLDTVTHVSGGTPVDAAIDGADRVLRDVAGPHRPVGGPAPSTHERPSKQGLDVVTKTVADEPRMVAERPQEPAVTPVTAAPRPVPVAMASHPVAVANHPQAHPASRAPAISRIKQVKVTSPSSAHRPAAAHAAIPGPETASEDTPGGQGPAAPRRLNLGDVSGTPAGTSNGPGAPTDGGSAAFLPAAIVNSSMACHRLPIVSNVEARRFDAEAPTVSPD